MEVILIKFVFFTHSFAHPTSPWISPIKYIDVKLDDNSCNDDDDDDDYDGDVGDDVVDAAETFRSRTDETTTTATINSSMADDDDDIDVDIIIIGEKT